MRIVINLDAELTDTPKDDYDAIALALNRALGPESLYRIVFANTVGDHGDIRSPVGGHIGTWEVTS